MGDRGYQTEHYMKMKIFPFNFNQRYFYLSPF